MIYEDKIQYLSESDFFSFFFALGANPRWVTSNGKKAIQIIGLCHGGENFSALFDPTTLKVHCFSECGCAFYFHNWVGKVKGFDYATQSKDFLEDWIDGKQIDFTTQRVGLGYGNYEERPYEPEDVEMVPAMDKTQLDIIFKQADEEFKREKRDWKNCTWVKDDLIDPEILQKFQVKYSAERGGILLPHHNKNGDVVGIYLRSFRDLRKTIREKYPDMRWQDLMQFPRAKYVPLLRDNPIDGKSSWSFPNSRNLYGLHKAYEAIEETGEAIIFEGAKSVMLAHQHGILNTVASHTYGAHLNHISMLIKCGAKRIILAFDKQYKEKGDKQYETFIRKNNGLAEKVAGHVGIARLVYESSPLAYGDAPVDKSIDTFKELLSDCKTLARDGKFVGVRTETAAAGPVGTGEVFDSSRIQGNQNKTMSTDYGVLANINI